MAKRNRIAGIGAALLGAFALGAAAQPSAPGAGLPTATWAAGTKLAELPHGGRITTFHRGKLYLGGTDNQSTWAYDISDPTSPDLLCTGPTLGNSHVWYKLGDLFFRQDLVSWSAPPKLYDLRTDFCNPARWTTPIHDFPLASQIAGDDWMPTYPYAFTESVLDARVGWWPPIVQRNLRQEAGIQAHNRFRLGNLLLFTPGDGGSGVAAFDIGDPANPRLLDVLSGNYLQYTTAWQIWRHYLVMMIGHDGNGPAHDANALVIDFSDPTDLKIAWTIPRGTLRGRYVHFQDHYAFAGHVADGPGGTGAKYNMLTRQVERTFHPPNTGTDFQWIPLGHLLLVSGSETNGSASTIYAHQDGLDRTPPTVGYHLPADGALNQPLRTGIGLAIHEQLDATTVNEQTIQLRPVGGDPLPAIVMHTSYDVVNVVPVSPLQPDTTYEVRLVANGVRDVAGNAMAPYSFFFSTGNTLQTAPRIVSTAVTQPSPALVGEALTFSAVAENATHYSWSFGDGSADSAWSASASAAHTYSAPGVYTARVQARSAANQVAGATLRLVVDPVPAAVAPSASASVMVAGNRVWALNPDHDSVAVFDADSRARLAVHAACDDPRSLARDAAGRTWIACRGDDRLVALDANGAQVVSLATGYGSAPDALLFDATGSTGYATLDRGALIRFDPASATETARIEVGFAAEALARVGNRLYAARLKSADDAGRIAAVELPAFVPAAGTAGVPGIALALDTLTPDSGTAGRGLPNYVAALAASPDGARLWYAAKKDNIVRGLARDGAELDFEKTVRVLLGAIDTAGAAERVEARVDLDNSALALALAPSPGGAVLFAALAGNDRVIALDPWQGGELARIDVGAAPRGLAVDAARKRLWVRNDLGRSVSVIDIDALTANGAPEMALLGTASSVAGETLPAAVLAGKRLFWRAEDARMSADGYLACASCHLDGGSDARTWDFTQRGEGLRRTLPLLGRAGMGHGSLHWSANFDELQDFEHDIREAFAGTGLMSDAAFFAGTRDEPLGDAKAGHSAELDALAAYAGSLDRVGRSPHRVDANTLTPSAAAGRVLFQQQGCARCHGGAAFTDSAHRRWHDVGTVAAGEMRAGVPLQGFDTPTLRGLWREGRLLHDGRAADPIDALLVSGARHGAIAALGAGERQQLLDYLRSIDDNEPAAPAPFVLQIASPAANAQLDPDRPVELVLATDVPDLAGIDVLLDGVVVATIGHAPWRASFAVVAGSRPQLQLRARHATGALTFTAPVTLQVSAVAGALFRDGFE